MAVTAHPAIYVEIERLKRRILWAERAGEGRGRQIAFLYRSADRFGRKLYPLSFCHPLTSAESGCSTSVCCCCRPDVFAFEHELLASLPQSDSSDGFCPFFDRQRGNCGIYLQRPLACRLYFNLGTTPHICRNPNDLTLDLFTGLRPLLEPLLGPYLGGYRR